MGKLKTITFVLFVVLLVISCAKKEVAQTTSPLDESLGSDVADLNDLDTAIENGELDAIGSDLEVDTLLE